MEKFISNLTLAEYFQDKGILQTEVIGESERMRYSKVSTIDAVYFLKQAKIAQLYPQIAAQAQGAKLFAKIINAESPFRVEQPVAFGKDWLLMEWLEGKPLLDPEDIQHQPRLTDFVQLLAYIDQQDIILKNKPKELCFGAHTPSSQYAKRTFEKCQAIVQKGVGSQLITQVIHRIEAVIPDLTPALQHGDFTPWHMLKKGKALTLVDCEHVRNNWPRYYDIANFYSALQVRFDRPDLAELLINDFQSMTGKDLMDSIDFRAMVVMRQLGRAIEYQDDPVALKRALRYADWQAKLI